MTAKKIQALLEKHLLDEKMERQFRCRYNSETKLLDHLLGRVDYVPGLYSHDDDLDSMEAIDKLARSYVRDVLFPKALSLWR